MPPAPTAHSAEAFGGSSSDRGSKTSARRHLIQLGALGIAAYAIALIATAPAALLSRDRAWESGASGTIWNGKIGIGGQAILSWQAAPLRSLGNFAPSADVQLESVDGVLSGEAIRHLSGRTVLENVAGPTSAALLTKVAPNLPFSCSGPLQANFKKIAMGSSPRTIDGEAILGAGNCTMKGGIGSQSVASMRISATSEGDRTRLHVTPVSQRRQILLDAVLTPDGQLDMGLTDQGAATLSFLGAPPGMRVKLPL